MSERCERTSERTSEWPSTNVPIFQEVLNHCGVALLRTASLSVRGAVASGDEVEFAHVSENEVGLIFVDGQSAADAGHGQMLKGMHTMV